MSKISTLVHLAGDTVGARFMDALIGRRCEYPSFPRYDRKFGDIRHVDGGLLTEGYITLSSKQVGEKRPVRICTLSTTTITSVEEAIRAMDIIPETTLFVASAARHEDWFTGRLQRRRRNELVMVFDGPPVLCFPHALLLTREAEPGGAHYYAEAVGAMIKGFFVSLTHNINLVQRQREAATVPKMIPHETVADVMGYGTHGNAD